MNHEGRGVEDREGLKAHAGDADGESQEGLEDEVIGERAAQMSYFAIFVSLILFALPHRRWVTKLGEAIPARKSVVPWT